MELRPRFETDRRRGLDRRKGRNPTYMGPERRSGLDRRCIAPGKAARYLQPAVMHESAPPREASDATAHRVTPRNGNRFHSPLLVVKRLQSEFAYVEADEAVGRRHVQAMMKALEGEIGARANSILRRRLEHLNQVKERAVYVHFGDDPGSETEYLCTVVIPGEPLVFEYESTARKRAVQPLLDRCAEVLGYDIVAITEGDLSDDRSVCAQH